MAQYPSNTSFKALTFTEITSGTATRPIVVYADGVYDLFHYGHVEQLRQAKQRFPNTKLIVGVVTDEDVLHYKGGPVVMTHEERVRSVRMCPLVDEVMENPPFYPTIEFADAMNEADRFLETNRTPAISTTNLVHRIISRVDEFVQRNATRGINSFATAF